MLNAKFVASGFEHVAIGKDYARITTSNDGIHWKLLDTTYPNDPYLRDCVLFKTDNGYWLDSWWHTYDLKKWESTGGFRIPGYDDAWAPEMFYDYDGNAKYVIAVKTPNTAASEGFRPYLADFDVGTGQITNGNLIQINGLAQNESDIDCHYELRDGKYYLWLAHGGQDWRHYDIRVFVSDKIDRDFNEIPTNLNQWRSSFSQFPAYGSGFGSVGFEAPTTLPVVNMYGEKGMRVYYDVYDVPFKSEDFYHFMHFSDSYDNLKNWTQPRLMQSSFGMRHMNVWNKSGGLGVGLTDGYFDKPRFNQSLIAMDGRLDQLFTKMGLSRKCLGQIKTNYLDISLRFQLAAIMCQMADQLNTLSQALNDKTNSQLSTITMLSQYPLDFEGFQPELAKSWVAVIESVEQIEQTIEALGL